MHQCMYACATIVRMHTYILFSDRRGNGQKPPQTKPSRTKPCVRCVCMRVYTHEYYMHTCMHVYKHTYITYKPYKDTYIVPYTHIYTIHTEIHTLILASLN